ncbi:phosphatidylserine decarboxylase-domain-containing protein [Melanogaster broomeanus]|nr:phosphatidylserine decarboxylase-domain-containing protein [Melanogaster broomeanus]
MIPPVPKKAQKIGRALKTAARFPARVSGGRGSGRNNFSPSPSEHPVVYLRLQVLGCKDLCSRGKHNSCDPFVAVSLLNMRHHTPVIKRNANPEYSLKDATFDFPIYLSLADRLGTIEVLVWDRDSMIKKEYLGEVAVQLEDWFKDGNAFGFHDDQNRSSSLTLASTRAATHVSGSVQIKLGFVTPPYMSSPMGFDEVFAELIKRSRPSLVSAPPTEGIGTLRSHLAGPAFEDDGGISSDEDDNSDEDDDDDDDIPLPEVPQLSRLYIPPPIIHKRKSAGKSPDTARPSPSPGVESPTPTPITPTARSILPKLFPRRPPLSTRPSYEVAPMPPVGDVPSISVAPPATTITAPPSPRPHPIANESGHRRSASVGSMPMPAPTTKKKFRKSWLANKSAAYNFSAANDIVGIVMLEIQGATDLPKLKNMTRIGWDMDPFVVISFGKKVFRTRVIRHSLGPTWDEKLLFHVRRYETSFKVQLTVLDWDKLSSNDHVGDASFDVSELVKDAPQPDPRTGLYDEDGDGSHPMKEFHLPLTTAKETSWESKHNPVLKFRAKYQPYDALRQRFWAQYLKKYDADDTGKFSHLEITLMLDSLGSTLSAQTIDSFFTRYGKRPVDDELTIPEVVLCLEKELCRPKSERKRLNTEDSFADTSSSPTPLTTGGEEGDGRGSGPGKSFLDGLDFSGPLMNMALSDESPTENAISLHVLPPEQYTTEPSERPLIHVSEPLSISSTTSSMQQPSASSSRQGSHSSSDAEDGPFNGGVPRSSRHEEHHFERVINVQNCPLCHRPRLNSKAEMDIMTHLAICASQDWAKVDRIVVGNFVTASQAQRKWYARIIAQVSSGHYKLGANSANIIVQNRITGHLEEEKMHMYVRLGIRLLYKGARGSMEGARARRLLKSLSIKQGTKYNSTESARDIQAFIDFHGLKVDEVLEPIDSFKTFNQFFYRKLKPDARPIDSPDDPTRLVSAADCRLMVFETVSEATRLWIKGREFSIARLLGDAYRDEAERYTGGALAIFRLAPQDYHRFHLPVDGTIGHMTYISGEYYTVNPQAIRSALDVYGENARKIVPIDSPQFGRVMAVCVGAMMVGSIQTTVDEGDQVKRGQELGYFAFGGSTIVVLFEKGAVEWDEDLIVNGRASLETLVRVGMGIGRCRRSPFFVTNGTLKP